MTIISIEASQREKERKALKLEQKKQMEINLVEKTNKNYQSVQSATNDKKMVNLLKEVRKSDATVDSNYARYNGTSIYNPPLGKKLKYLEKDALDRIEKEFEPHLHGKKPKPRKTKKVVKKTIQPIEEITFSYMLEQLGHERFVPSTNTLFGGLRNTSATYLKETT